jgi:hypothetical protein
VQDSHLPEVEQSLPTGWTQQRQIEIRTDVHPHIAQQLKIERLEIRAGIARISTGDARRLEELDVQQLRRQDLSQCLGII